MEIKTLEELQTAVETKAKENETKELITKAKDLGIDLKEYGLNEDGTPIKLEGHVGDVGEKGVPKGKPEGSSEEEEKLKQEEQKKLLVDATVAALKELNKPEEKPAEKARIWG